MINGLPPQPCSAPADPVRHWFQPVLNLHHSPLQIVVSAEEFRHLLQLLGADLADAADGLLAGVCGGHAEQLAVAGAAVHHVEDPDWPRNNQATGKRGLAHDHHGVQGSAIFSQGIGNEARVERIAHGGVQNPIKRHQTGLSFVFVFIGTTGGNLHHQAGQPWPRGGLQVAQVHRYGNAGAR